MPYRLVGLLAIVGVCAAGPGDAWEPQASGTTARFRGLSVVDERVAWASGTRGTVVRTVDAGQTWANVTVPNAETLDFRDIEAFDGQTAVVLAAGPGSLSRIYRTQDGGRTWTLSFTNPDETGFLDAIAFWDRQHGMALGDPVEGRFQRFETRDGGQSWQRRVSSMPPARTAEGAFAASGTCLVALTGTRQAWFGTGGAGGGRVFRTEDRGDNWTVTSTPTTASGPSEGIFSLAFRDAEHGFAIGGDYQKPDQSGRYFVQTTDGGRTWSAVASGPPGYRSCLAIAPGRPTQVAVGPGGSDLSTNAGVSWQLLGRLGFHAVATSRSAAWAVGDEGRIARLVLPRIP